MSDDSNEQATEQQSTTGPASVGGAKRDSLQTLFVDVTGTEEVVETQDHSNQSKAVIAEDDQSVANYLEDMTRQSGLEDAVSEPDNHQ